MGTDQHNYHLMSLMNIETGNLLSLAPPQIPIFELCPTAFSGGQNSSANYVLCNRTELHWESFLQWFLLILYFAGIPKKRFKV